MTIKLGTCYSMKKALAPLIVLVCTFVLFACGGGGGNSSPTQSPTNSAPASINQVVQNAVKSVDGMILYIDQGGKEPAVYTGGFSDQASSQSMSSEQLFKIASISKLFIAVAATKLVHENALQMDDTIATWLPEYANAIDNSEVITLRNLIQHRSGVPDFDSQRGFSWEDAHTDIDATLEFALNRPADFSPGARYEYSNTNYLLIAKILNKVLTYNHELYIHDQILVPLGLNNTYLQASQADANELVSGYWGGQNRKSQAYVIPGGSMISNAKDVAVFTRALNKRGIMSNQELQIYPYFFNHSGWLPGYQSVANYYGDIDTVIVQFINTTGGSSEAIAAESLEQTLEILRR